MSHNAKLRTDRLVFYENDVDRLETELDGFLELSGARCTMLVDREGHLVSRRGEPTQASQEAIAALVAGSFAATQEMARLLGEEEFTSLFHQGLHDSIQVQLIGNRTLLAVVFDERTNLGMVRFYAQETAQRLEQIFEEILARPQEEGGGLSESFSSDAARALDELF